MLSCSRGSFLYRMSVLYTGVRTNWWGHPISRTVCAKVTCYSILNTVTQRLASRDRSRLASLCQLSTYGMGQEPTEFLTTLLIANLQHSYTVRQPGPMGTDSVSWWPLAGLFKVHLARGKDFSRKFAIDDSCPLTEAEAEPPYKIMLLRNHTHSHWFLTISLQYVLFRKET